MAKIYYAAEATIPSLNADSVHVMKMCQALANNGHDVTLFAVAGVDVGAGIHQWFGVESNFTLKRISPSVIKRGNTIINGLRMAAAINRAPRPDLVWTRSMMIAWRVARMMSQTALIYESHSLPNARWRRALERRIFSTPSLARVVLISGTLAEDYGKCYSTALPNNVIVAHDGADPVEDPGHSARSQCHRSDRVGSFKCGYVGHLYPGKGMEVIARIAPKLPTYQFHVVGGTTGDIAKWRRQVPENVTFHGHVPQSHLPDLYAEFDAILVPNQRSTFGSSGRVDIGRWTSPMKLFEALAYGKACVVSDLPVLREVVTHGETALMAAPDVDDDWINALTKLERDAALRLRLGARARRLIVEEFSWTGRAEAIVPSRWQSGGHSRILRC